ncbi:MAG: hypothetical protein NVSMB23_17370 [Myxococcales bacterium]
MRAPVKSTASDRTPARLRDLPFGRRAVAGDQSRILGAALAALRPDRPTAAFDLDSTLLDNKPRQARIVREFGEERRDARLATCAPAQIVSWDLRDTALLCGLSAGEAADVEPDLRRFWLSRFFTSAYCAGDAPVAGAREYLARVLARGGHVLYLTGRHREMAEGTIASFRRAGFPLPSEEPGSSVSLWLKPVLSDDDDAWKDQCHARLQSMRGIACAFDNEPTHVNAYARAFPDAVVVHLDTDHSQRPVEVSGKIPSILDFRMEPA